MGISCPLDDPNTDWKTGPKDPILVINPCDICDPDLDTDIFVYDKNGDDLQTNMYNQV